ncbi:MAG TPA: hypothetical protein ENI95_01525 [Chloroflexi bacterium]|nr:hypothetical protein [Chloroflexota bacterium]
MHQYPHTYPPPGRMIHVFVGTKAQLIKMAPLMHELERRNVPYRFINAGQHAATIATLLAQFDLRPPDVTLFSSAGNISSLREGFAWLFRLLWQALIHPAQTRQMVFGGYGGLCFIHGDTATTLISLIMARRAGLSVAHVESGLRSFNIFSPFPEELIRLIAMRFSDLLFAPNEWAYQNLQKMKIRGKAVLAGGNTIIDALAYAQKKASQEGLSFALPGHRYAVMSIHRFETIRVRRRLNRVVQLACSVAERLPLKFILHKPTAHYLQKFGLLRALRDTPRIELLDLQPYLLFVQMLKSAEFVITDGGSIQEETAVLGTPCLILRTRTERRDGLGRNALLAGTNEEVIESFLENFAAYRFPPLYTRREGAATPSASIVTEALRWLDR